MEYKELKSKAEPEIQRQLAQLREQLRNRRFQVAQGQHKDVRELRELKRDIARLMTRLQELSHAK